MYNIGEIYKVHYMKHRFAYVGLLRNEKQFNIHDKVFFVINGNEIAKGKIVGVELPIAENPEYSYKVEIAEDWIREKNEWKELTQTALEIMTLDCESIFGTIKEAKESATENLERMYKLQKEEIDRYFEQFA
jgi:hypothetical protein